jgi:hypothetical protein
MSKPFQGFTHPEQNWFKMPNEWTDITHDITSLAELKVVEYVLRHTWGYGESTDWEIKRISTSEFIDGRKRSDGSRMDRGTGLSAPSVYDGLKRAVEDNLLVKYVDNTDAGRVTHYYRMRMVGDEDGVVYAMGKDHKGKTPWSEISEENIELVKKRAGRRCSYCGRPSHKWHIDHIVPLNQGGPDDVDNLALACPECNLSKRDRTPDEWGHQVFHYQKDDKILYRGWLRFFTGPRKETLQDPLKKLAIVHRKTLKGKTLKGSGDARRPPAREDLLSTEGDRKAAGLLRGVLVKHDSDLTGGPRSVRIDTLVKAITNVRTFRKVPESKIVEMIEWLDKAWDDQYTPHPHKADDIYTYWQKYRDAKSNWESDQNKANGNGNGKSIDPTSAFGSSGNWRPKAREVSNWMEGHGSAFRYTQENVDEALVALGYEAGSLRAETFTR